MTFWQRNKLIFMLWSSLLWGQSSHQIYGFITDSNSGEVLIGANVFINPGTTVGENSVVGSNSVVTKNIPPFTIYGGVPAKLIRKKMGSELLNPDD